MDRLFRLIRVREPFLKVRRRRRQRSVAGAQVRTIVADRTPITPLYKSFQLLYFLWLFILFFFSDNEEGPYNFI